ncbi:metal-dependent transcriptional regulator [Pseudarthrobacter sp. CC12]|uniref:metal-dependent transcriptional regulator n=1 Tax=Pseudarthrobacter sp. CC12 TaxID=3029193 RepID=UPI003264209F
MSSQLRVADLTAAAQDYLKLIYTVGEWSDAPVTIGVLAGRLGVSMSTASEGIGKLARQGLVSHAKYGSVELTGPGLECALMMVRRHRILETYLVRALGYSWDEVHPGAEALEHAVSEDLIDRMDAQLGHPGADPHGDPIPTADGQVTRPDAIPLKLAPPGGKLVLRRVADADPALLRYLSGLGLVPGTELTVADPKPFAAGTAVRVVGSGEDIILGDAALEALWAGPAGRD